MPRAGRKRKFVCAQISVFLQLERGRCHYPSAFIVAAVMCLRYESRKVVRLALKVFHKKITGTLWM